MIGPFATASRRTPHCHSPGVATVARRHCRTPPAHRCPQRRRQQRQRVTEGTAMDPWNGPNNVDYFNTFVSLVVSHRLSDSDIRHMNQVTLR